MRHKNKAAKTKTKHIPSSLSADWGLNIPHKLPHGEPSELVEHLHPDTHTLNAFLLFSAIF